jgi:hypothetical protein
MTKIVRDEDIAPSILECDSGSTVAARRFSSGAVVFSGKL